MFVSEAKCLIVNDSNRSIRNRLNYRREWGADVIGMEDGGVVGPVESGELLVVGGEGEVDEEGEDLCNESCRNGGKKKKKKKQRIGGRRHGKVLKFRHPLQKLLFLFLFI